MKDDEFYMLYDFWDGCTTTSRVRYGYDTEGRIATLAATNTANRGLQVEYLNESGYNYGYTLTTPNGATLTRTVTRDSYRRSLTLDCTTRFNNVVVASFAYTFDAHSRPIARNNDRFAYNDRDEIIGAIIGTNHIEHAYDTIGNHLFLAYNSATNIYANNALNQTVAQYSIVSHGGTEPRSGEGVQGEELAFTTNKLAWSAQGGLQRDVRFIYAFDAEDQLVSVTSSTLTNGAIRVVNAYDYRHRRISKTVYTMRDDSPPTSPLAPPLPIAHRTWYLQERHDFVYDDWNLIHETVTSVDANSTTNVTEIEYFWGPDLSNTLQGAGGVGGLLAVSQNGQFYFPVYDNLGNVVKYLDENDDIVAEYYYDDLGRIFFATGHMSHFLYFRFSTKYNDMETRTSCFPYRHYAIDLGCWLSRDLGEDIGGVNLYTYCNNCSQLFCDPYGLWVATDESSKMNRRVYVMEGSDTATTLADKVGLDVSEIGKWAKFERGKVADPKTATPYVNGVEKPGCYISVPNIWIAADLMHGGSVIWDQVIRNQGGTIGIFVGTGMFTFGDYKILKPATPRDLLLNVSDNKGDVWGMVVFGHGDRSGRYLAAPLKEDESLYGKIITQDMLIRNVQAGGYKISSVYMMQCYSSANGYDAKWKNAALKYYGYSGMNVLGSDMGAGRWPWNWTWHKNLFRKRKSE